MARIAIIIFILQLIYISANLMTISGQRLLRTEEGDVCKNNEDMECLDRHVNELFVNINRFYSPNDGYIDISYLNHPWYNSTTMFDPVSAIKCIDNISTLDNYDDEEKDIIRSFPSLLITKIIDIL
ncbi:hypothetical protein BLA29_007908 [Euroglyphus maynei]|uniref:Uncharacterized protein n=1 Tax=Euroglyphus maynei TaxID=6958 RepID=A0A1Y3BM98_EURMA|nr:hypothetical protein BLA29_007908 [Euroglyphus maynei]